MNRREISPDSRDEKNRLDSWIARWRNSKTALILSSRTGTFFHPELPPPVIPNAERDLGGLGSPEHEQGKTTEERSLPIVEMTERE